MRKLICLLLAAVLCVSLAAPAFAAENTFVPSISYKPHPDIVPLDGDRIGELHDENGESMGYIGPDCLDITAVADAYDPQKEISTEVSDTLRSVYESLEAGSTELPYEKFGAGLNGDNMVIRDLMDISLTCDEHRSMLAEEGVTLDLTFDLEVAPEAAVYVMTYDEETRQWTPVETVNNGDGTVTCTFEELCVVAFCLQTGEAAEEPEEEAPSSVLGWLASVVRKVVRFLENLLDRILKWF